MKKAILFDLDGVIVDTERSVWHNSSVTLLASYHKTHDEKATLPLVSGARFEDATKILHEYYAIQDTFENFLERRRQLVHQGFSENVSFMDGFQAFYQRIKKHPKAIATSMDTAFLALTMTHLPLQSLFGEHIYTIAEVGGKGKPHPDIFLHAARNLGHTPENCIVIEDAPKGVTAAKAAGMRAIALTTTVPKEQVAHADYLVDSFLEITDTMFS